MYRSVNLTAYGNEDPTIVQQGGLHVYECKHVFPSSEEKFHKKL